MGEKWNFLDEFIVVLEDVGKDLYLGDVVCQEVFVSYRIVDFIFGIFVLEVEFEIFFLNFYYVIYEIGFFQFSLGLGDVRFFWGCFSFLWVLGSQVFFLILEVFKYFRIYTKR